MGVGGPGARPGRTYASFGAPFIGYVAYLSVTGKAPAVGDAALFLGSTGVFDDEAEFHLVAVLILPSYLRYLPIPTNLGT